MLNRTIIFTLSLILFTNLFPINDNLQTGIQLFEEGELDKALNYFEKVVRDKPDNPEVFYYLGRIFFRNQKARFTIHGWAIHMEIELTK